MAIREFIDGFGRKCTMTIKKNERYPGRGDIYVELDFLDCSYIDFALNREELLAISLFLQDYLQIGECASDDYQIPK